MRLSTQLFCRIALKDADGAKILAKKLRNESTRLAGALQVGTHETAKSRKKIVVIIALYYYINIKLSVHCRRSKSENESKDGVIPLHLRR